MIGWTRLVGATAWIMSASFGCAGTTPKPSTPTYFRSPPLDYGEAPRSASDGEVLGVLQHPPDDWLLAGATTDHAAPGWSKHYGQLRFEPEYAQASHGTPVRALSCPPESAPLAPEDAEKQAALWRSWRLEAVREPPLPVLTHALAEMPVERSGFLSCNSR
jgi:hypothetical protein